MLLGRPGLGSPLRIGIIGLHAGSPRNAVRGWRLRLLLVPSARGLCPLGLSWHLEAPGSHDLRQRRPSQGLVTHPVSLQTNSLSPLPQGRAERKGIFKSGLAGAARFYNQEGETRFSCDLNTCPQQPRNAAHVSIRPRGVRCPDRVIFKIRFVINCAISPGNSGRTARENLVLSYQISPGIA